MKHTDNSQYILKSVDKALGIIDLFASQKELGSNEIDRLTGLGKSTTFRMLATLENRGYVLRTADGKYRLGMKFYAMKDLMATRNELVDIMRPMLTQLASETGETCHLSVMSGDSDVYFLDKVLGTGMIHSGSSVGYTRPIYATSAGLAMLAYKNRAFVRRYAENLAFEQFTPKSMRTVAELYEKLEETRSRGYAEDDEEFEVGLVCYSVAILSPDGHPVAAFCTSGPSTRMHMNRDKYVAALRHAGSDASALLAVNAASSELI